MARSLRSTRMRDGLRQFHAPLLYPPHRIVFIQVGKLLLTYRVVHTDGDMSDRSHLAPSSKSIHSLPAAELVEQAAGLWGLRVRGAQPYGGLHGFTTPSATRTS